MKAYDFTQSPNDYCLFFTGIGQTFLALLVYGFDVLLMGADEDRLLQVKQFLKKQFSIKDLGHAIFFLGIQIARSSAGIYIKQQKYVLYMISEVGLQQAKPVHSPMVQGCKLIQDMGSYFQTRCL